MMEKNFQRRPSVALVMEDPWFSDSENSERQGVDEGVLDALRRRSKRTDLRAALLADVASRENLAQMKDLNELFLQLDSDNDGIISADDVRQALSDRWSAR